ncbi:MAG: hypothetical protein ABIQ95_09540, partial [Bdellovibrionia bacterium]
MRNTAIVSITKHILVVSVFLLLGAHDSQAHRTEQRPGKSLAVIHYFTREELYSERNHPGTWGTGCYFPNNIDSIING